MAKKNQFWMFPPDEPDTYLYGAAARSSQPRTALNLGYMDDPLNFTSRAEMQDNPYAGAGAIWESAPARDFAARAAAQLGLDIYQTQHEMESAFGTSAYYTNVGGELVSRFGQTEIGGQQMWERTFEELAVHVRSTYGTPYMSTSQQINPLTGQVQSAPAESPWAYMHGTPQRQALLSQGHQVGKELGATEFQRGPMAFEANLLASVPGFAVGGGMVETGAAGPKMAKRLAQPIGKELTQFSNLPLLQHPIAPQAGEAGIYNVVPTVAFIGGGYFPSGQSILDPIVSGGTQALKKTSITLPNELAESWQPNLPLGQRMELNKGAFQVGEGVSAQISAAVAMTPITYGFTNTLMTSPTGAQYNTRKLEIQSMVEYGGVSGMKLFGEKTGMANIPGAAQALNLQAGGQQLTGIAHITQVNDWAQAAYAATVGWTPEQFQQVTGQASWGMGSAQKVIEHLHQTGQIQDVSMTMPMYIGPAGGGELEPQLAALVKSGAATIGETRVDKGSRFADVTLTGPAYVGTMANLPRINWPYKSQQVSAEELARLRKVDPQRAAAVERYSQGYNAMTGKIYGAELATQGLAPNYPAVEAGTITSRGPELAATATQMMEESIPFELQEGVERYGFAANLLRATSEMTGGAGIAIDPKEYGLSGNRFIMPDPGALLQMYGGGDVEQQIFGLPRTAANVIEGLSNIQMGTPSQEDVARTQSNIDLFRKQMQFASGSSEARRRLQSNVEPRIGGQIQSAEWLGPAEAFLPEARMAELLGKAWGSEDFGTAELAKRYRSPQEAARAVLMGEAEMPDIFMKRQPITEHGQLNARVRALTLDEVNWRTGRNLSLEEANQLGTLASRQAGQRLGGDFDIDVLEMPLATGISGESQAELNQRMQAAAISNISGEIAATVGDIEKAPRTVDEAVAQAIGSITQIPLEQAARESQATEANKSMMGPAYNFGQRAMEMMVMGGGGTEEQQAVRQQMANRIESEMGAPLYASAQDALKLPESASRMLDMMSYNVESKGIYKRGRGGGKPGSLGMGGLLTHGTLQALKMGADLGMSAEGISGMLMDVAQPGFGGLVEAVRGGPKNVGAVLKQMTDLAQGRVGPGAAGQDVFRNMIETSPLLKLGTMYGYQKAASKAKDKAAYVAGLDPWESQMYRGGEATRNYTKMLSRYEGGIQAPIGEFVNTMQELTDLGIATPEQQRIFQAAMVDVGAATGSPVAAQAVATQTMGPTTEDMASAGISAQNVFGGMLSGGKFGSVPVEFTSGMTRAKTGQPVHARGGKGRIAVDPDLARQRYREGAYAQEQVTGVRPVGDLLTTEEMAARFTLGHEFGHVKGIAVSAQMEQAEVENRANMVGLLAAGVGQEDIAKYYGVESLPAQVTGIAGMISAQKPDEWVDTLNVETFATSPESNVPASSPTTGGPTVRTMASGGGGGGGSLGGGGGQGGGGGGGNWKKRKKKLAEEIENYTSGKSVKRPTGVLKNKMPIEQWFKYAVDEQAIKRLDLYASSPNFDQLVEVARKIAAEEPIETKEERSLMAEAKRMLSDVGSVHSGVRSIGTFYGDTMEEAGYIAAEMPEGQREAYLGEVQSQMKGFSEVDVTQAPGLANAVSISALTGVEPQDIREWKSGKYKTAGLVSRLGASRSSSGRAYSKMESGWRFADVVRGMHEGTLPFASQDEAEQYAASQGLTNQQGSIISRLAGGEKLTAGQRMETLRADPGLSQYISSTGKSSDLEGELQKATQSLIDARKDLADNTKGMSKAEKEALDNILVSSAKGQVTGILSTARDASGIGAQAALMGSAAYGGFAKEAGIGAEDRFSATSVMRGVKSLFSPFSPTGALIKAVWRMGVGQAGEDADMAMQQGRQQFLAGAGTGGFGDMGEAGPLSGMLQRTATQQSARLQSAYAFEQAWGWTKGQGALGVPRAVLGPGLAAGAATGIGLSHLGGIQGLGFLGPLALPLAGVVTAAGLSAGITQYGANAAQDNAYNQMVAAQETDVTNDPNATFLQKLSAGFSGGIRDYMSGGTAPSLIGAPAADATRFTTQELAQMAEQKLTQPYASLSYAERASTSGLVASRLRRDNERFKIYSEAEIKTASDEMYAYTGVSANQTYASMNSQNVLAASMEGSINWQASQQAAITLGMGSQGTMNISQRLMGQEQFQRNQTLRAYGQVAGLRQFGWQAPDLQNLAEGAGELFGTAELSMQRITGGDRRAISKYASGEWQTGLEAQGFNFRGQAWAQSQDALGFGIGTTGGLRTLQRGTSQEFWDVIKDNPLAAQMSGGRSMRSALHSTFGAGTVADQWDGQSMMGLQQLYNNFQLGVSNFQQGWEQRAFASQYGNIAPATPTAQQVAGGWQPQELTSIDQVGGLYQRNRQVQLAQTALGRATTAGGQYGGIGFTGSFGFQEQGMANQYTQFTQNWQLQGQQMQLGRQWQLQGFDWQAQDMATNRARSLTQRGWQTSDLDLNFGRANVRYDWQEADLMRSREQRESGNEYQQWNVGWQQRVTALQRGWQEQDWELGGQMRQQSYGWNLEDINESIRFASGRQRKQLLKQRERMTITEAQGEERADTEEERTRTMWRLEDERFDKQKERMDEEKSIEDQNWQTQLERLQTQRDWTQTDYNTDRERMSQRNTWDDEDFNRQSERFQSTMDYQNQVFELQKRNHDMSLEHFEVNYELQQRQFEESKVAYDEQVKLEEELRRIREDTDLEEIERARQMLALNQQIAQSKNAMDAATYMFQLMGDAQSAQFLDRLTSFLDQIRQIGNSLGYPKLPNPY